MSRVYETRKDDRPGRPAQRNKPVRVNSRRRTAGRLPEVERDHYYSRIQRLLDDGLNDQEVAERVGLSDATIRRYRNHPDRRIANVYERTAA